jgi:predicted TIM-barrel fold metal-dependent hydrolase
VPDLRYKPPHAPLDEFLIHSEKLGVERYVLVQPSAYGRDNACMLEAMRTLGPLRCRGIVDVDEDKLASPFSVAHMGMFPAGEGVKQPGFREFLDFHARHPSCWVKLTGAYRISTDPQFKDSIPLARALIEAAPRRAIWGSDYPHLGFADKATPAGLFELLAEWAPEEATRRRILSDNPERCFGF